MKRIVIAYVVNHGIERVPEVGRVADFVPPNYLGAWQHVGTVKCVQSLRAHDRDEVASTVQPTGN
jgi:hypothetical protein